MQYGVNLCSCKHVFVQQKVYFVKFQAGVIAFERKLSIFGQTREQFNYKHGLCSSKIFRRKSPAYISGVIVLLADNIFPDVS